MSKQVADPWHAFCDRLKLAGDQLLRPEAPGDALDRAEGYRYLSRLLRAGLESQLEFADPRFPGFYSLSGPTIKIGADNPDNLYANAAVSGRYDYRISGRRYSPHYLAFATKVGGLGSDGSLRGVGAIDSQTMRFEDDGRFEILLSTRRQADNWLPMSADTTMLLARQTFLDREHEQSADFRIECLNAPGDPELLTREAIAERLRASADFVIGTAKLFADWAQRFKATPNAFAQQDQQVYQRTGGDPALFYVHGYWQLAPDEALVVSIPKVEGEFWNFQVNNYWMESLDYRYHLIHLNKRSASYDADGGATLVIAHRDPGMPNWLSTVGHAQGTMLFRTVGATTTAYPKAELRKLAELGKG